MKQRMKVALENMDDSRLANAVTKVKKFIHKKMIAAWEGPFEIVDPPDEKLQLENVGTRSR